MVFFEVDRRLPWLVSFFPKGTTVQFVFDVPESHALQDSLKFYSILCYSILFYSRTPKAMQFMTF